MKTISISNLKSHLSETLRNVYTGEEYIVMDRKHPIALISPPSESPGLIVSEPKNKNKNIRIKFKGNLKTDPAEFLFEDRNRR